MFQLVLTKNEGKIYSSLFEEQRMIQVNVEKEEPGVVIGNIYVGKVKNIVKNINAAFVEIADQQICYLSLNDPVPPTYTNGKKSGKIVVGDELLVQVHQEAVKTKQPSVTTKIQLPGRYVVLTQGEARVGVSGKIQDPKQRLALQQAMEPYVSKEHKYGMVVRTNAKEVPIDCVVQEAETLSRIYLQLMENGKYRTCFSMVYQAPCGFLCDIRDGYEQELERIITDEEAIYERVRTYLQQYQPENLDKLSFYEDPLLPLKRLYSLDTKIKKALQERVWLDSGGYLVIQPTEALTVIDINTGKSVGKKKNTEAHFLKINLEAAKEIARQLRLRNLSGIIVIDFIDLSTKEAKEQLIQTLKQEIQKDPVKTVFVEMTKLNLVELTRKKVRKPLHEQVKE